MLVLGRSVGLIALCLAACGGRETTKFNPTVHQISEERLAYPSSGATYLHWDKGHGYQVTYYSERHVWLWYPGNRAALRGDWVQELVAGEYYLCFTYPHSSYNPVTGDVGGQKECQLQTVLGGALEGALAGDVYNLSSGRVPYVLRRNKRPAEF
ncbi:hypothetical protein PhaeoP30_02026 [Phaeobacter inhibens]|nr:hypothetical protein PhaeoP92_02027 [Phaeobacter inhibens]AUQ58929.1 hypothetical protein PhaeoP30_02026 [Phaeobacter inhibens]AUQ63010.1 hypothetical protein PhaeoP51_02036 [Phaeobacter inhibens]AUQ78710.1 hypothetical protein PhaeoP74_02028 [Phaeobacter inhibens]AUQ82914.1 hypothetical protein PhaeoP57_01995 [Phaeobacter inhibens]